MDTKILGAIQVIGALIAVILGYIGNAFWAILVLALVLAVVGIHHFTEKEH